MAIGNRQPGGNSAYVNAALGPRPRFAPEAVTTSPTVTVTLDTVAPGSGGTSVLSGTTLSWSHRIGPGPNRALYVGIAIGAGTDSMTATATYKGTSLTSVGKVHNNNGTGGYVQLFRLVAPPIGPGTVTVTMSAAPTSLIAGSVSYFNVDQSAPETVTTAFGSGTTASVATSGAPGDVALALIGAGSAVTAPTNGTTLWIDNVSGATAGGNGGMSNAVGAQGLTQSWTLSSDWWGMIGADLLATAAADSTYVIDTPLWTGDFETGDLSQFTSDTSSYQPSSPVVATSSPTPIDGTYRGAFSVPAGTSVAGAGVNPRCEAIAATPRDFQEGDDYWFGGWVQLGSGFTVAAGQFSVVTQWKNEGTGSPPLELSVNADTAPMHWRIDGGFGYPTGSQQWVALDDTANAVTTGTWYRWDFHVVFASDPNVATIDAWLNGVQVVTGYHSTTLAGTLYPSQTSYWKIGYYRSEAITTAGTVYHDGWKVGRTAASVGFVSQQTASAAMSGAGTMSASGSQTISPSSAMSGAGTMTATGSQTISPSSAMSGAGTMSVTPAVNEVATVAMSGAGTMTATGSQTISATVPMSGTGSMSASGSQTASATASMSGTGSMSASGSQTISASATMSGAGTMVAQPGTALTNDAQGTSGAAVTTSAGTPNPFSAVSLSGGATLTYDTAHVLDGTTAILEALPTAAATAYVSWASLPATAQAFCRFYIYLTAIPSVSVRVATFLSGGTVRGSLVILSTGKVRLQNSAGQATASTTASIPLNTWVRVEYQITGLSGTTGNPAVSFFSGANLSGTTADTGGTASGTAATSGGSTIDEVRFGASAAITMTSAWSAWHGEFAYSDQAMPAPVSLTSTVSASVAMSGSGTMTATGSQTISPSSTMSGAGTMTATGSQTISPSSAMSGSGTMTATGQQTISASAAMTGVGTMTATGSQTISATAAMTGVGSMSVTPAVNRVATIAMSGVGSMTGTGQQTIPSTIAMSGVGSMGASAGGITGSAAMTGAGTMTATGSQTTSTTAAMTGAGVMAVTGRQTISATVAMSGVGVLSASGQQTISVAIAMTGTGTTTATGSLTKSATPTMSGTGTLAVTGTQNVPAVAALAGVGVMSVSSAGSVSSGAAFVGTGALSASGLDQPTAAPAMSGTGTLGVGPAVTRIASILITGTGSMGATGRQSISVGLAFVGAGTLAALAVRESLASVAMLGVGSMLADGSASLGEDLTLAYAYGTDRWAALTGTDRWLAASGAGRWTATTSTDRWAAVGGSDRWGSS